MGRGEFQEQPSFSCWDSAPRESAARRRKNAAGNFGPSNPFYAPSTLPFQAPPFDKIKDSDYQPAIDAGMAQQLKEVDAIANNPAPPTFENTLVALERSGQLLRPRMVGVQLRDAGEYRSGAAKRCRSTKRRAWPRWRTRSI